MLKERGIEVTLPVERWDRLPETVPFEVALLDEFQQKVSILRAVNARQVDLSALRDQQMRLLRIEILEPVIKEQTDSQLASVQVQREVQRGSGDLETGGLKRVLDRTRVRLGTKEYKPPAIVKIVTLGQDRKILRFLLGGEPLQVHPEVSVAVKKAADSTRKLGIAHDAFERSAEELRINMDAKEGKAEALAQAAQKSLVEFVINNFSGSREMALRVVREIPELKQDIATEYALRNFGTEDELIHFGDFFMNYLTDRNATPEQLQRWHGKKYPWLFHYKIPNKNEFLQALQHNKFVKTSWVASVARRFIEAEISS